MHMALPLKKSEVICFYDLQYRWAKRSTDRGVEIKIELNDSYREDFTREKQSKAE